MWNFFPKCSRRRIFSGVALIGFYWCLFWPKNFGSFRLVVVCSLCVRVSTKKWRPDLYNLIGKKNYDLKFNFFIKRLKRWIFLASFGIFFDFSNQDNQDDSVVIFKKNWCKTDKSRKNWIMSKDKKNIYIYIFYRKLTLILYQLS